MKKKIKIYTSETNNIDSDKIKSIILLLDEYLNLKNAKFNIPGSLKKNDCNYNYRKVLSKNWDDTFKDTRMISFSTNNLYGGIEIMDKYSSIHITESIDVPYKLSEFITSLVNILSFDLLFVFEDNSESDSYDISYGSHDKGLGIKAGLRDVYWINYYGKSFTELIGKNNLLSLPIYETKNIGNGIYFKLTKKSEDAYTLKDAIKAQIGHQYFVPEDIEGTKHMQKTKERSGIFGVLGHLLHLHKTPANLLVAEKRPEFD